MERPQPLFCCVLAPTRFVFSWYFIVCVLIILLFAAALFSCFIHTIPLTYKCVCLYAFCILIFCLYYHNLFGAIRLYSTAYYSDLDRQLLTPFYIVALDLYSAMPNFLSDILRLESWLFRFQKTSKHWEVSSAFVRQLLLAVLTWLIKPLHSRKGLTLSSVHRVDWLTIWKIPKVSIWSNFDFW